MPLDLSLRDGPRDECGVFGIYAPEHDVSRHAYFALYALQHRGQESAGIAAADAGGYIITQRALGLVSQVFKEHDLKALSGDLAIGHVRYSTTGSNEWENSQPVHRSAGSGGNRRELALAHNGNLINAVELHAELREQGVQLLGTSDSEIIAALLASHPAEKLEDAIADVLPRLQGAFSTVVMTDDRVIAFRDPAGLRPLVLGQLGDRYCVASESCAFDIIGAKLLRDVQPGEMVSLGENGLQMRQVVERRARGVLRLRVHLLRAPRLAHERRRAAGRARPDGRDPRRARRRADADLVIAVPDSGNAAARGYARGIGPAAGRRLRQEPLRRAHVHPARPGAAQARPAAEVQPAAGDRRRQAARRRRRLDRARQHDAPDRADAARRGRARGAHAHQRAADQAPLPLRDRHVHARGDDRPRAHGRRRSPRSWAATRWPTSRWPASTRRSRGDRARHCDACFTGEYPLAGTDDANGKFALERSLPLVAGVSARRGRRSTATVRGTARSPRRGSELATFGSALAVLTTARAPTARCPTRSSTPTPATCPLDELAAFFDAACEAWMRLGAAGARRARRRAAARAA